MANDDRSIYGAEEIARRLGMGVEGLRKLRKRMPEAGTWPVASISNHGGGYGRALMTYPGSLQAVADLLQLQTSAARRDAANARWEGVQWTMVRKD